MRSEAIDARRCTIDGARDVADLDGGLASLGGEAVKISNSSPSSEVTVRTMSSIENDRVSWAVDDLRTVTESMG